MKVPGLARRALRSLDNDGIPPNRIGKRQTYRAIKRTSTDKNITTSQFFACKLRFSRCSLYSGSGPVWARSLRESGAAAEDACASLILASAGYRRCLGARSWVHGSMLPSFGNRFACHMARATPTLPREGTRRASRSTAFRCASREIREPPQGGYHDSTQRRLMSKQNKRMQQAVGLLDQAIRRYKVLAESSASFKPNTDTSVAMFERYVKRLEKLVDIPGAGPQFWSLHQKVYIRLLKQTLKQRN